LGGAAPLSGRSPWREILSLVEAERRRDRVVAYGKALDLRAAVASLRSPGAHPDPRPAPSDLQRFRRALFRAVVSVRLKEMLAQRAVEAYNGGQRVPGGSVLRDPSGKRPSEADRATLAQRGRALEPLRSSAVPGQDPAGGPAHPMELGLAAAAAAGGMGGHDVHVPRLYGTGPGTRLESGAAEEARQRFRAASGREPHDDKELYGGVRAEPGGVASLACRALAEAEGHGAGSPLSAAQCRDLLRTSVERGHREAATAFRLLSRGPAQSLCAQVGRLQCHETLQEALTRGHSVTAFALKTLLLHSSGRDAVFGRRRLAHDRSRRAREAYLHEASRARANGTRLAKLEAAVRASDASLAGSDEALQAVRHSLDLPVTGYLPPSEALARTALLAGRAAASGSGLAGEFRGDGMTPRAVREACGAGPDGAAPPLTVNCLCARVGPARCTESLFRAYVYGHADVVEALKRIRGDDVDGPATTFCREVGWRRCRMQVTEAADLVRRGEKDGRAVALLWRALHGDHPPAPFDGAEALDALSRRGDVRVMRGSAGDEEDGPPVNGSAAALRFGDHSALRDVADVLRRMRRYHRDEQGRPPLEVVEWAAANGRTDRTLDQAAAALGLASAVPTGGVSMVRHAEVFRWLLDDASHGEAGRQQPQYETSSIFERLVRPAEEVTTEAEGAAGKPAAAEAPAPPQAEPLPVEAGAGPRPDLPPAVAPRTVLPSDLAHAAVKDGKLVEPADPAAGVARKAVAAWDARRRGIVGVCGPNVSPHDELRCLDLEGSCSLDRSSRLPLSARTDGAEGEPIPNREECEATVDVVSGGRGSWMPLNTFVPLPYPGALAHVIRADDFGAVADLFDGGEASPWTLLVAAPRPSMQLAEASAACVATFPSYTASALGSRTLSAAVAWRPEVVRAARRSTAARPPPSRLAVPLNISGDVLPSASLLTAVWHVRSRPTLSSDLPDGAVVVGAGASISAGGPSGKIPVPAALFCPNTVFRPLQLATAAGATRANTALVGRGAMTATAAAAVGLRWQELKLNNITHPGLHGFMAAANAFWGCVPRALDGGGCLGDDLGSFGDPAEALCNPATGENCPCMGASSPGDPFGCEADDDGSGDGQPRRRKRRRVSTSKTTRTKQSKSMTVRLKLKDKQGKAKKAKKCETAG